MCFLRRNTNVWIVAGFLLALAVVGGPSGGVEPCDPYVTPIANWALQYRPRVNRCEGFYEAEIGASTLEIVGLTHGRFSYALEPGEHVHLSCPLVNDVPVHVRAVGVPLRMYYRMDTNLEPTQSVAWPLDDVVWPQRIPSHDLGILAWLREDGDEGAAKIYVPVLAATPDSPVEADDQINLCVRSAVDVEAIQWRIQEQCEGEAQGRSDWVVADRPVSLAGRSIRILLPLGDSGRICVEVAARNRFTDEWLMLKLILIVGA